MEKALDDLDAVRALVETLGPFESQDQERIIRWTREKLGLQIPTQGASSEPAGTTSEERADRDGKAAQQRTDIKTFVATKAPATENQFAATVAYYYMFVAPEAERKESIDKDDLLEACRLANRNRLKNPAQTLVNARNVGLLDKSGERGRYSINTVGENLVAMTLPSASSISVTKPKVTRRRKAPKKATEAAKKDPGSP